jgi:hypothetical protein
VMESEKFMLDIASEQFYDDRIESTVNVTTEDMQELFENLEEPLTIPEKRVLEAVQFPADSVPLFRRLSSQERDEFLMTMPGFPTLAQDPENNPYITRPLSLREVPGYYGEDVFLIDPSDTLSWLGPLDLPTSNYVGMFRLIEVIPERPATFEEVEDRLRVMTRSRMEEQATVEVMCELEEKFGMTINEEILDKLPEDPGLWANLH